MLKFAILRIVQEERAAKEGITKYSVILEYDAEQILSRIVGRLEDFLPEQKQQSIGIFKKTLINLGWTREEIASALTKAFRSIVAEIKEETIRLRG